MGARTATWMTGAVLLGSMPAQAGDPAAAAERAPAAAGRSPAERPPIRLGMSPAAAEYLTEIRVRKLVEIELRGAAELDPFAYGPLDSRWVSVWIDLPDPSIVLIQVLAADRPLIQRRVNITGLPWDVAARFVAIATSESIRRQLRPKPPPPPPTPTGPTPDELRRARRAAPSAVIRGTGAAAVLPGGGAWLAGPAFAVASHSGGITQALEARWLIGDTDAGPMRWFEGGAGADYRFWITEEFRLLFGANAGIAAVALSDEQAVRAETDEHETWSARAALSLGAEARLSTSSWLGLRVEPGAVLREIPFDDGSRSIDGAWLGVSLGLVVDQPLPLL